METSRPIHILKLSCFVGLFFFYLSCCYGRACLSLSLSLLIPFLLSKQKAGVTSADDTKKQKNVGIDE